MSDADLEAIRNARLQQLQQQAGGGGGASTGGSNKEEEQRYLPTLSRRFSTNTPLNFTSQKSGARIHTFANS